MILTLFKRVIIALTQIYRISIAITHRLSVFLSILLIVFSTSLFAADSVSVKTPTANPGLPILIQQGHHDFTESTSTTVNSFDTTGPVCPTGFKPYAELTPYKAVDKAIGDRGICFVDAQATGSGYKVNYIVKKSANMGSNLYVDSYAFQWSLYCYPNSITFPPLDPSCSMSTSNANTYSLKVYPIQSGYYDFGKDSFVIYPPICTGGWRPHVEVTPLKTKYDSGGCSLKTFRICVMSVDYSGTPYPNYKVNLKQFVTYEGSCPAAANGVAFAWTLYCYPPSGTGPPAYDTDCN